MVQLEVIQYCFINDWGKIYSLRNCSARCSLVDFSMPKCSTHANETVTVAIWLVNYILRIPRIMVKPNTLRYDTTTFEMLLHQEQVVLA